MIWDSTVRINYGWDWIAGPPRWTHVAGPLENVPVMPHTLEGRSLVSAAMVLMALMRTDVATPHLILAMSSVVSLPTEERPNPANAGSRTLPHATVLRNLDPPDDLRMRTIQGDVVLAVLGVGVALEDLPEGALFYGSAAGGIPAPPAAAVLESGRYNCLVSRDAIEWSIMLRDEGTGGWWHTTLLTPQSKLCSSEHLSTVCEYFATTLQLLRQVERLPEAQRRANAALTWLPSPPRIEGPPPPHFHCTSTWTRPPGQVPAAARAGERHTPLARHDDRVSATIADRGGPAAASAQVGAGYTQRNATQLY